MAKKPSRRNNETGKLRDHPERSAIVGAYVTQKFGIDWFSALQCAELYADVINDDNEAKDMVSDIRDAVRKALYDVLTKQENIGKQVDSVVLSTAYALLVAEYSTKISGMLAENALLRGHVTSMSEVRMENISAAIMCLSIMVKDTDEAIYSDYFTGEKL